MLTRDNDFLLSAALYVANRLCCRLYGFDARIGLDSYYPVATWGPSFSLSTRPHTDTLSDALNDNPCLLSSVLAGVWSGRRGMSVLPYDDVDNHTPRCSR